MVLPRRHLILGLPWLLAGRHLAAVTGPEWPIQGLDQFATGGPPCTTTPTPTPAVPPDRTFTPGAPDRRGLVPAAAGGTPLRVSGTVTGVSCGRIAGARVEVWQADSRGVYDMAGFLGRGRQSTDAQGAFQFDTVVPGPAGGRPPHLGVHVSVPGRAELWTELFFPGDPRNATDPRFQPELVLRVTPASPGKTASYDLILDL